MTQVFSSEYYHKNFVGKCTNGIHTYTKDIDKYWYDELCGIEGNNIITTAFQFQKLKVQDIRKELREKPDFIVQYLHVYLYDKSIDWVMDFYNKIHIKPKYKIIFVTQWRNYYELMKVAFKQRGIDYLFDAVHIPMAIDTESIPTPQDERYEGKKAIYFGNIWDRKETTFAETKNAFKKKGWTLDVISKGLFNGQTKVSQKEAWEIVGKYKYGVGVDRCAKEMQHMGLKVMLSGDRFGGLITNDYELMLHEQTNCSGRIVTFDREVGTCIDCFDLSIIPQPLNMKDVNHAEYITNKINFIRNGK